MSTQALGGPPRDMIGYGSRPPKVTWPDGAALALSPVINYEEGSEYETGRGDDRSDLGEFPGYAGEHRDFCVESVFEYGSRVGVWNLFRLLDEYGLKTTVYASAEAIEKNPDVGAAIERAGHEPHGHGWRWTEQFRMGVDEERAGIARAVETLERLCGSRPVGWYSRYSPSINTRELLVEEGGFLYDSLPYNDDLPYYTPVNGRPHLVLPYNSLVYNDARYVFSQGFTSPSAFVDMCKRAIDEYRRQGHAGYPKMMSIGTHPRYSGQLGRLSALREILEYALECGDVWIARRRDIAEWWTEHHEEFER